jgi:hypothetical protein
MIFVLIASCFLIPYEIAFPKDNQGNKDEVKAALDKIFDVLFFFDAIVTFKVAVLNEDYDIIDNRKDIANNYLKGWFTLDILSCIPYGILGEAVLSKH